MRSFHRSGVNYDAEPYNDAPESGEMHDNFVGAKGQQEKLKAKG
jgi:hypothetical protein